MAQTGFGSVMMGAYELRMRSVGMKKIGPVLAVSLSAVIGLAFNLGSVTTSTAKENLIIAASPSLAAPLEALGREFEAKRPDVQVRIFYDTGLSMRQTIAAM